ncbi:acyl carrier protein [Teredinibacter purpureus]|uniref:acyl carrier protein n=1 Tax=Teredinibacter purpureus TaxID=2731756 RepID=UPI0005F82724|nr:phosphopantetheine-binding protein [Teredinibacter purpureus]
MKITLLEIIKTHTKSPREISVKSRFVEDLGFDSFSMMLAISDIEDAFDVAIPSSQLSNLLCVNDLYEIMLELEVTSTTEENVA